MQEIVIDILLAAVILTAAVFRFLVGTRPDSGMTKKQKVMLTRILIASVILLVLQLIPGAGCGSPSIWRIIFSSAMTFCGRPSRAF